MRKLIGSIFALMGIAILISACSGDTYAKKLDAEKKAIKNFIKDNNIKVLDDYPESGVFQSNEYFKDSKTGVYLHVVDSGLGEKAIEQSSVRSGTDIYIRFDSARTLTDADTIRMTNNNDAPLKITYGVSSTYVASGSNYDQNYYFKGPAFAVPLPYVRSGAKVRLLVPFNEYSGSVAQQNGYYTMYYGLVTYTYEN